MQELQARILAEGRNIGRGILKVDAFINHRIDPDLMMRVGEELARRLAPTQPTLILTAETSGIAPALAAASVLHIPVLFARKSTPLTMDPQTIGEIALSHTYERSVQLLVSSDYMTAQDRVIIVDDFLATAQTILALARLVNKSGAHLVGIGAVIEKTFERGREHLAHLNVPIESLVLIANMDDGKIVFGE